MRELELIERIRLGGRGLGAGVRVGIGDDCAVLRVTGGCEVVVTTDFSLEGRHFRRDWHTAEMVGHRCLVRGLSDVAGMGGRPVAAFLSLGLPRGFDLGWVDEFMRGFRAVGDRFGVELAGGDTAEVAGEEIVADVVVTGEVEAGRALLRSGARVGNGIYVTGRLGGSAVGLRSLAAGGTGNAAHCWPEARVVEGRALVGVATACMDLSDGLGMDLRRMCLASGVGAELDFMPLAEGATEEDGLFGGEDYELLYTAGGDAPGIRVGTVVGGSGVRFRGEEVQGGGWEHFG